MPYQRFQRFSFSIVLFSGFLLTALCFVAIEGADVSGIATSEHYNYSAVLDPKGNYFLFWNHNGTHVTFEVHVKTKGYVGFGLSLNGNMYPADVVVGWVKNGVTYFKVSSTLSDYIEFISSACG